MWIEPSDSKRQIKPFSPLNCECMVFCPVMGYYRDMERKKHHQIPAGDLSQGRDEEETSSAMLPSVL